MIKIKGQIPGNGEIDIELPDESLRVLTDSLRAIILPASSELGTLVRTPIQLANCLLAPVRMRALVSEYEEQLLRSKLDSLLNRIGKKDQVQPSNSFLRSAEDAFPFVASDEQLRSMFAALFANASHRDRNPLTSSIFMDILRSMTSQDALNVTKGRYLTNYRPLIRIFECKDLGKQDEAMHQAGMPEFYAASHKDPVFSNYALTVSERPESELTMSISIYNLHRHELINIGYIEHIIYPEGYRELYDQLKASEFYRNCNERSRQKGVHLCLTRGYASPTDLGRLFHEVCCKSPLEAITTGMDVP